MHLSDRVLEVEFERSTPYFDKLVAFNTYYPLREDFFESTNGRYGADADMLLSNGPYVVTEWIHGSSMLWKKNPYYWNDQKGFLDEIVTAYITHDVNAKLNLFKGRTDCRNQLDCTYVTHGDGTTLADRPFHGWLVILP